MARVDIPLDLIVEKLRQRISELEAAVVELQQTKDELQSNNQQLLDIIEFLPDATFVVDNDGRIIVWNRAIEEMTGVAKRDIIGQGDYAYAMAFYGKRMPFLLDQIDTDVNEIKSEVIYEDIHRNGHTLYAEVYMPPPFNGNGGALWVKASPLYDTAGKVIGAIESIRDITERRQLMDELDKYRKDLETMVDERTAELQTALAQLQQEVAERKQAQEAHRASEVQLRRITDNMLDLIGVVNTEGIIQYESQSCKDILGYEPEEMVGKAALDFVHPEDIERVMSAFKKGIKTLSGNKLEFRHRQANGHYIWLETTGSLIFDDSGKLTETVFCSRDITERKQAEQLLRLSEDRFSKAFNASPNIMSLRAFANGRYIYVNDSFIQHIGYKLEEVIGKTVEELNIYVNHEDYAKFKEMIEQQGSVRNFKHKYRSKSGEVRHSLVSIELIELNREQCMLSVVTDITELDRLEQEMARLDRLHLIGEMAASIGHEVRNPMTTVRGFLQILGDKAECVNYKEYFDLMIEELDRANSIITQFLSLAKNKPVAKVRQSLNNIVETIYPLIKADVFKADKDIGLELASIPSLFLDEKEIRQLILNLVRNGLEAMSTNGTIIIKTHADSEDVVLEVKDQGNGIEPSILDKLGTPFVTTKENGTGLGLSVCYSIASRHNARIDVQTSPSGTTFFVRFKVAE